jgi:hypothetical protein
VAALGPQRYVWTDDEASKIGGIARRTCLRARDWFVMTGLLISLDGHTHCVGAVRAMGRNDA